MLRTLTFTLITTAVLLWGCERGRQAAAESSPPELTQAEPTPSPELTPRPEPASPPDAVPPPEPASPPDAVPPPEQDNPGTFGALPRDVIRDIVRANIEQVRACYNTGLAKEPTLAGRVAIRFIITPTGTVGSSVVLESTVSDPAVGSCIADAAKGWQFPEPRGGGNVFVTYPFNLSPG